MKNYILPLLKKGKALFLAYDHGFEHGHTDLIGKSLDPNYILEIALKGGYTGIVLQKGIAEKYYFNSKYENKIPLILKVNGKTNILKTQPYSSQNCSIEYAKKLKAKAVGYTIYLGSAYEPLMFKEFSKIQEEAHKLNLAVIAWMYPAFNELLEKEPEKITLYGARLGLELGADIIKIKYPNSKEIFKKAVELAGKTKIVLSGGPKIKEEEFLKIVKEVMEAGAIGLTVGRNVWQNKNPLEITKKIKKIIFKER